MLGKRIICYDSGVGCRIGNVCTGSKSYADNLMLLSPSVQGLDFMIALYENLVWFSMGKEQSNVIHYQ